jgi:hypothetical protein
MEDRPLYWAWQRRCPKDYSRPVGAVLGRLAGSVWFKQQKHVGRIVQALHDVLPQGLLDHLAVDGFRNNTLHLRVDSASHRYDLITAKEQLLAALNEQVSGVFVRDIRLTLARLDQPGEPRSARDPAMPD